MKPYRFALVRLEDETGISGTGIVAMGVMFADGRVSMRWCTGRGPSSTTDFDSIEDLLAIHGHGGKTFVSWIDRYEPGGE